MVLSRSIAAECPYPLDSIGELTVALYNRWEPEAVFVIIKGYFDESGTHAGSPVMTFGCFVAPATRWNGFNVKWRRLLSDNGLNFYHTRRFIHGNGEFHGWSDARCLTFVDRMATVLAEHVTFGLSLALREADYRQHYRRDGAPQGARLDSMYGLCFRYCLHVIIQRCREAFPTDETKIAFVLESGHNNTGDAKRIFHEIKNDPKETPNLFQVLRSIAFMDKKKVPALQAADGMATNAFQSEKAGNPNVIERPLDATFVDDISRAPSGLPLYRHIFEADMLCRLRKEIEDGAAKKKGHL